MRKLLERYDKPGPRYTSYPTAVEFHEGVGAERYREHLARAKSPLALYFHLPFCEHRCLFCGCNVVVTEHRDVANTYLGYLEKEIATVAGLLPGKGRVSQYHWGGGTPTYYTPDEMRRLHAAVSRAFEFEPDAELAIEVDPRVTTRAHLETLADLGFNRLSCGVQDFDEDVQEAIGRIQPFTSTSELVGAARELGIESVNLDLIYGLPRQAVETFTDTVAQVIALRPDRVALYSYAHVPWLKGHQRKIDASELPDAGTKLDLYQTALHEFRAAGYEAIGMDHFALPDDELAVAAKDGTLWRNFMGYTVQPANELIGFGMSGIGEVAGAFFQNARKLHQYQSAVEESGLAVERGYALTEDDWVRRRIIASLMCRFKADGLQGFDAELAELRPMEEDGLVRIGDGSVEVTEKGRLFVRNICMVFDTYLPGHRERKTPRFSRTV
jgi:oxygen-independent coproporphyrinogen-3 oxidase